MTRKRAVASMQIWWIGQVEQFLASKLGTGSSNWQKTG